MDRIEERIVSTIEEHGEEIKEIGRRIFACPELGYKEFKTSAFFSDFMGEMGIKTQKGLAITGAKGYLKGGKERPAIALVGELDALPIADSPYSNPDTGAAHCCGHNAQMAAMMGAAFGLCLPEVREAMAGTVVFFAVPAEEFVEVEFKHTLMEQGAIAYGGGKSELIRIGAFDDIHIAVGHHVCEGADIRIMNNPSNGFLNKIVHFQGKASHAAESPHRGVDALNAASLTIQALNMQQETYRDRDSVRVHGFISRGGEAMNVVADHTTMEYSVRANNIPAIENASEKFDRSVRAGAMATGCGARIITMPGYLPTVPVSDLTALLEAAHQATGRHQIMPVNPSYIQGGSTDFGDVSQILPLLQFHTGGYGGALHDKALHPVDEDTAYVLPAKIFALTAYNLLKNQAANARTLMDGFKPSLTKEEYIRYMDDHNQVEEIPPTRLKHPLE